MKKLVCDSFGNIYYATILKNGLMSSTGRVEVTDDAINAVIQHLTCLPYYEKGKGFAGYSYQKKDGGKLTLCVFDNDMYRIENKTDKQEINNLEQDFESDQKFLVHIIQEICAYAYKNGMEQDETIRTIAENMKTMLEFATFNNNKGIENDG